MNSQSPKPSSPIEAIRSTSFFWLLTEILVPKHMFMNMYSVQVITHILFLPKCVSHTLSLPSHSSYLDVFNFMFWRLPCQYREICLELSLALFIQFLRLYISQYGCPIIYLSDSILVYVCVVSSLVLFQIKLWQILQTLQAFTQEYFSFLWKKDIHIMVT
jgi:hypothetical protein